MFPYPQSSAARDGRQKLRGDASLEAPAKAGVDAPIGLDVAAEGLLKITVEA